MYTLFLLAGTVIFGVLREAYWSQSQLSLVRGKFWKFSRVHIPFIIFVILTKIQLAELGPFYSSKFQPKIYVATVIIWAGVAFGAAQVWSGLTKMIKRDPAYSPGDRATMIMEGTILFLICATPVMEKFFFLFR